MLTFEQLDLDWIDAIVVVSIGLSVFLFTYFLYKPLIKWLKRKGWVGYDIHKTSRPETAESGGIGLTIGMVLGILLVGFLYPSLWNEVVVFEITIILSAIIGLIDDRIRLSSLKKIILMVATGVPLFLFNYLGFIHVDSPTLPILGHLRLTIIYPLVLPIIIAVLTNTVNMLEGYNGEGSGTTAIAMIFIIISAVIARSAQGVLFGIPVVAAILGFFLYNRYPAKVFPGDIGTLVIGAAIGLVSILGSLEVVMFCAMLTHIFNSFYVLSSVHGFKESHTIKKKDIFIDENDYIYASNEEGAPLTLPRLILAEGPLKEDELVRNFYALAVVSGLFALISEIIRQWTLPDGIHDWAFSIVIGASCLAIYIWVIKNYPRIFGITVIMILLLVLGVFLLAFIDQYLVGTYLNWLYSFSLAGIGLFAWYLLTIKYFWKTINKYKNHSENEQSIKDA